MLDPQLRLARHQPQGFHITITARNILGKGDARRSGDRIALPAIDQLIVAGMVVIFGIGPAQSPDPDLEKSFARRRRIETGGREFLHRPADGACRRHYQAFGRVRIIQVPCGDTVEPRAIEILPATESRPTTPAWSKRWPR